MTWAIQATDVIEQGLIPSGGLLSPVLPYAL